jgi:hypothetical protein
MLSLPWLSGASRGVFPASAITGVFSHCLYLATERSLGRRVCWNFRRRFSVRQPSSSSVRWGEQVGEQGVAEQQLELLEIPARPAAEPGASAGQVVERGPVERGRAGILDD